MKGRIIENGGFGYGALGFYRRVATELERELRSPEWQDQIEQERGRGTIITTPVASRRRGG
jgi:hypothetical protein